MSNATESLFIPEQLAEEDTICIEEVPEPKDALEPHWSTLDVSSSLSLASPLSLDQVSSQETPLEESNDATPEETPQASNGETQPRAAWCKIGWFAGVEHSKAWSTAPTTTGPLLKGGELSARSLAEPGSAGYIDPALAPANESEWKALYETAFDDLAREPPQPGCTTYAQRYRFRLGLEKSFFSSGGALMHNYLRPAPRMGGEQRVQFHCRLVGQRYAVGTMIMCTDQVDAVYDKLRQDAKEREVESIGSELSARIEESLTVDACQDILEALSRLHKDYTEATSHANDNKDALAEVEKLRVKCEERLHLIEADNAHIEECAKADPPQTPWLKVFSVGTDSVPRSQQALSKLLSKLRRPSHVLSVLSVSIPNDGRIPLHLLAQPEFAPPPQELFVHRRDAKGHGPYEQITDATIKAKLAVLSTAANSQGTASWKGCKAKLDLQIPCCMSDWEHDLLVADHSKFMIVRLPAGKKTGEEYALPSSVGGAPFKVFSCSLTRTHICVMGFQRGSAAPLLIVIERGAKSYQCLCTFIQADIPFTSAVLSSAHPGSVLLGMKDGTLLRVELPSVPSKKGRPVFTVYHPSAAAAAAPAAAATEAAESQKLDASALDDMNAMKRALPEIDAKLAPPPKTDKALDVDHDAVALSAIRKARPWARIDVFAGSPDCVLHIGKPLPISRIVEHCNRIIVTSSFGMTLFRLKYPEESPERRVHMVLPYNASFDFRGNLLVAVKQDNSVQMAQLFDCRVEATLSKPAGLMPAPPEMAGECQAIAIHDGAIIIVHADGSRRVMELKDPVQVAAAASAPIVDADATQTSLEEKAKSFVPEPPAAKGKRVAGKNKNKKKGKGR